MEYSKLKCIGFIIYYGHLETLYKKLTKMEEADLKAVCCGKVTCWCPYNKNKVDVSNNSPVAR